MIHWIILWVLNAVALAVTGWLLPGVKVRSAGSSLVAVAVLGLVNVLIKPILMFFSIPLLILTVGLFTLVVNAILINPDAQSGLVFLFLPILQWPIVGTVELLLLCVPRKTGGTAARLVVNDTASATASNLCPCRGRSR